MANWKLLGLAGIAGVAAAGVAVSRRRRAWIEPEPDDLRRRLHDRLRLIDAPTAAGLEAGDQGAE